MRSSPQSLSIQRSAGHGPGLQGVSVMNGLEAYQTNAVATQSKGRLVVMLYDGAIKFLKLAIKEMEAKNYEAKGKYISKAQDIISELNTVLNVEVGGDIARNLRSLYLYMNRQLNQANIKVDPEIVKEVISLLETLNKSWKTIAE
jgi:flagellar protein FliS